MRLSRLTTKEQQLLETERLGVFDVTEFVCWMVIVVVIVRKWRRMSDEKLHRPHSKFCVVKGEVVALRPFRDIGRHQRTASEQRPSRPTDCRRLVSARQKQNVEVAQRPAAASDCLISWKNNEERQRSAGSRRSLSTSDINCYIVFLLYHIQQS